MTALDDTSRPVHSSRMVRDNTALSRFELEVNGSTAYSQYHRSRGVVTFLHTEVPGALRGHGAGATLAAGALAMVRSWGEKVYAKCPYMAAYIAKHPEVQDLVVTR
jgi:predicted GNAT family acetyltransferase